MMVCNVISSTLDTLMRQQCVILINRGAELPITIPIARILSFHKNTIIIDNSDRRITRAESIYYNNYGVDFIAAGILRIEPEGNIFVSEIPIDSMKFDELLNLNTSQSFGSKCGDFELSVALKMAFRELNERRLETNVQASMMPQQQFRSQTFQPTPITTQTYQNNNINQPSNTFAPPIINSSPFIVQPKEQFKRPATFGPFQARSNPLPKNSPYMHQENIDNTCEAAPIQPLSPFTEPWIQEMLKPRSKPSGNGSVTLIEDVDDGIDPKMWITEQSLRRDVQKNGTIFNPESMDPFANSHKKARIEAANHISGMINAILASGNTNGILPNDGPVSSFVNGDGDIILSYSDGSISPAIRPNIVELDDNQMPREIQENDNFIRPAKKS